VLFWEKVPTCKFFYVLVKTIHEIFLHENSPPSLTLQELSMYILFLALLGMIECILVTYVLSVSTYMKFICHYHLL
jgi:hypothetical protein